MCFFIIAALIPDLVKANFQCAPRCSDTTQSALTEVTTILQSTYPQQWQILITHFVSGHGDLPEASAAELAKWLESPAAAEKMVDFLTLSGELILKHTKNLTCALIFGCPSIFIVYRDIGIVI